MNINISIKDYLLSIIIMNDIKLRDNLKKIKDYIVKLELVVSVVKKWQRVIVLKMEQNIILMQ